MKLPVLKCLFSSSVLFLTLLTACNGQKREYNVKVLKKITHPNQYFQYQYLSIPDSVSAEELLLITANIRESDERSGQQTVYNYYSEKAPDKRFAVLNGFHGGKFSHDTLELIQYGQSSNMEFGNSLKQIQKFKKEKKYIVSDSCFGIWRNWANPLPFYIILYKKGNEYFVELFNPDSGFGMRKEKVIREESSINGIAFLYESQERVGFTPPEERNTNRYILNEFGDITWLDQYGKGAIFVQGVYNYVCACDHQQDKGELRSKSSSLTK